MSHAHTHDQADPGIEAVEFPESDPVADARRLLAEVEESRRQACAQEISDVLARHGFNLQASQPSVFLVPRG